MSPSVLNNNNKQQINRQKYKYINKIKHCTIITTTTIIATIIKTN